MTTLEAAEAALAAAPGPTPWHRKTRLYRLGKPFDWYDPFDHKDERRNPTGLAGRLFLQLDGKTYGIFGFQCYVKALADERFVAWHYTGTDKDRTGLQVDLYDARALREIVKPKETAVAMLSSLSPLFEAEPIASVIISADLADGYNRLDIPPAFSEVDELLMYGESLANGRSSNGWDKSNVTLVQLLPRESAVRIYWQRWFNEGQFDFMWMWPDKVAREPKSGRVVGHGVRLGVFEYDDSLEEIVWLKKLNP